VFAYLTANQFILIRVSRKMRQLILIRAMTVSWVEIYVFFKDLLVSH